MSALLSPREYQLGLIAELRQIEARTRERSAQAEPLFTQRGQLLPRERVARLLDPGTPWLELSTLAGWLQDLPDPALSVPGGGAIVGIGMVSGTWVMLVADDSGIDAGALQALGIEKFQRAQAIALQNKLPFVHLVESAGANLLKYKVEQFVLGGGNFHGLARLSAAGIPVLSVVHGSSTAGGAYMTGLADQVIMVRGRGRAFLAGPPLLKAATGEIADDETLGGTDMHSSVSGLVEHVAEDACPRYRAPSGGTLGVATEPPHPLATRHRAHFAFRRFVGLFFCRPQTPGRHVACHRTPCRWLAFFGVQTRFRSSQCLRSSIDWRPPRGHHQQQRAAGPSGQQQDHAFHSNL